MVRRSFAKSVIYGGIVAGTVDIGAAALIYLTNALKVMQAIASGVLGKASYSGGASTEVLGLLLQWLIGILAASVYTVAALRFPILLDRWVAGGIGHGIGTFIVMMYSLSRRFQTRGRAARSRSKRRFTSSRRRSSWRTWSRCSSSDGSSRGSRTGMCRGDRVS